jgi:D-alanyl-D-alanine dipeptidase
MVKNGFRTIASEWWHYYDEDLKERIPIDIPLEKLKEYKF